MANKDAKIVDLHKTLFNEIKSILPLVYEEVTPNYIALRNGNGRNICEFHLYKTNILIYTRIPLNNSLLIGKKVPDSYL